MDIRYYIIGLVILGSIQTYAHDFTATIDGQQLFFDITNKSRKTATVTYNGNIADRLPSEVSGTVKIPAKVKHGDDIYEITAIGQKAFANSKCLKGIVIPSGIKSIGDFAFENCDSLSSVVFPGSQVNLGQGIFFNCTAIENVTIGSDWTNIDFTMFRWSNDLKEISIPAKIEKIKGIKKLKGLQAINVDPNNSRFSSHDGMLYSKDGAILYACPRGVEGKVTVKEGTKKITEGSLIDCNAVTALDFPESLENVSFRETSRMKGLEYIVMRSETPIYTGFHNGEGDFLFQLATEKVQLIVPDVARKEYEKNLATEAGEYSDTPVGILYLVSADQLPNRKNIRGVKNFDKY